MTARCPQCVHAVPYFTASSILLGCAAVNASWFVRVGDPSPAWCVLPPMKAMEVPLPLFDGIDGIERGCERA